jgi:hypothetical protein
MVELSHYCFARIELDAYTNFTQLHSFTKARLGAHSLLRPKEALAIFNGAS